ncbi:MAG: DUF1501 domain-containing protein [Myxococcales bacterium]|nr:DUF1501 domain-containing protein [Myxococcales bacterium]
MNGAFADSFKRFIAALDSQSNEHGNLLANTLIIVGSDLGRFPKLNAMDGKDHLPQTNFFFAGQGIAAGTSHGRTNPHRSSLSRFLSSRALGYWG